jgi:DNA-binding NarL/FixJ family response regulator
MSGILHSGHCLNYRLCWWAHRHKNSLEAPPQKCVVFLAKGSMLKCILIVDDNERLRHLIRDMLEGESGFEVCGEAVDGYDAIEKAERLKPDLIILDMSMPRMNGIEAAPRLKKILPETPIVMFTSYEAALEGFDVHKVGIDMVVPKDNLLLLVETVQGLLEEV